MVSAITLESLLKKIPDGKFKITFMHVKPNYFKYVERFYDYYHHIYLPVVNGQANGLQTPNEGINQRNSKCLGQMWQTNMLRPYISKNLDLVSNSRQCSAGYFLLTNLSFMDRAMLAVAYCTNGVHIFYPIFHRSLYCMQSG